MRRLVLAKQTLTELAPDDLVRVVAGDAPTFSVCTTTLNGCTYPCTV